MDNNNIINELCIKRTKLQNKAKEFFDTHCTESGAISSNDDLIYTKMKDEIVRLWYTIERLKQADAIGREIATDNGSKENVMMDEEEKRCKHIMDTKARIKEVKQQINIKQQELCGLQMELGRLEEDLVQEVRLKKRH